MAEREFICPNCGAEVPAKARACPECGSDEKTGWSRETIYDGTGIGEGEEFRYEEWLRRERGLPPRRTGRQWVWWVVAALLVALFVLMMVFGY